MRLVSGCGIFVSKLSPRQFFAWQLYFEGELFLGSGEGQFSFFDGSFPGRDVVLISRRDERQALDAFFWYIDHLIKALFCLRSIANFALIFVFDDVFIAAFRVRDVLGEEILGLIAEVSVLVRVVLKLRDQGRPIQ